MRTHKDISKIASRYYHYTNYLPWQYRKWSELTAARKFMDQLGTKIDYEWDYNVKICGLIRTELSLAYLWKYFNYIAAAREMWEAFGIYQRNRT
jgi:hypothetical protein